MAVASFVVQTKVVYGPGVRQAIAPELKKMGAKSVLLVSDCGLRQAGVLAKVEQVLIDADIPYQVFADVEEDPSTLTVEKGAAFARQHQPDALVICGGGSATCAGKGIALLLANGGKLTDYQVGTHKVPPLPMIVLPTTAGSGTEVAPRFLIKEPETGVKQRYGGENCYSRLALLDPELLLALPPGVAISASLDALCHAIEAYTSTEANLITDALALEAIRLLAQNIGPAALTGDVGAREKALVASTMANMACGNAKLGLVHGLTYGDFNGRSHGLACGILLPFVLEYLLPACEARLADIAAALGAQTCGNVALDAQAAIEFVKAMYLKLGVPRSLREIGLDEAAVAELTDISMRQVHLETSLRPVGRREVEGIFRQALAGW